MRHSWRRSGWAFRALVVIAVGLVLASAWLLTRGAEPDDARRGAELFRTKFTPEQGLGPLFNQQSCSGCHLQPRVGGVGRNGLATELRVGRLTAAGFDQMIGRGGPVSPAHSVAELGADCDRAAGIPAGANVTSVRNTPSLFGSGLIDAIPDEEILAGAVARGDGVQGRPNLVLGPSGRRDVGRFGWKAATPTLEMFVAQAFRDELGLTSPLARKSHAAPGTGRCVGDSPGPELDADVITAVTGFVSELPAPRPRGSHPAGAAVFRQAGCATCHTPTLRARTGQVPLFSDLLLHDMGRALDDRVVQGTARGRDWRTTPLWGLSQRTRFLHDGRANTLEAAILDHGGEAETARRRFLLLSEERRRSLLEFLRSL